MANDHVTIKGRSNDTLEIILAEGVSYRKLRESLIAKLNKNKSFFDGANPKVVIKGKSIPKAQQEDIKNILFMDYSLVDVTYIEYETEQKQEELTVSTAQNKNHLNTDILDKKSNKTEIVASDYFAAHSVFVSHTVRSGQRIECEGDIVVLGDVNPGAELIAGGNIAVMGTLRGLAHAGATGRKDAIIAAFKLNPSQLRISSKAILFPDNKVSSYPELAQLIESNIVIRPIIGKKII